MKGISSKVLLALAVLAGVPVACDSDTDVPTRPAGSGEGGGSSGGKSSGAGDGGRTPTTGGKSSGGSTSPATGGAAGDTTAEGGDGGQPPAPPIQNGGAAQGGETQGSGGADGGSGAASEGGTSQSGGATAQAGAGGQPEPSLCDLACAVLLMNETCETTTIEQCRTSLCVMQDDPSFCRYDKVLKCLSENPTHRMGCRDGRVWYSKASDNPCYDTYVEHVDSVKIGGSCEKYED